MGMEQSSSAAWECWDRELPGSVHTWTVIRAPTLCWERCGGAGGCSRGDLAWGSGGDGRTLAKSFPACPPPPSAPGLAMVKATWPCSGSGSHGDL